MKKSVSLREIEFLTRRCISSPILSAELISRSKVEILSKLAINWLIKNEVLVIIENCLELWKISNFKIQLRFYITPFKHSKRLELKKKAGVKVIGGHPRSKNAKKVSNFNIFKSRQIIAQNEALELYLESWNYTGGGLFCNFWISKLSK